MDREASLWNRATTAAGPTRSRAGWLGQYTSDNQRRMMRAHLVVMVLIGLTVSLYRSGLHGRRGLSGSSWANKIANSKKLGRFGDMSLKSTLSVLSMAGAMALFASIESSLLQNGDTEGLEWLKKEKEAYLNEISLMEPGWFSKP